MAIVKWDPFRDLMTLREKINSFLHEGLQGAHLSAEGFSPGRWTPPMDIIETADHYLVVIEAPGVDKERISISIEEKVLTVQGERAYAKSVEEENFIRIERHYGTFKRGFRLPRDVDDGGTQASFRDGILEIIIPKVGEVGQRPIDVKIS